MNISEYAIRKPVATIVSFIVVLIFGIISFVNLRVDLFPNVDIPVIWVSIVDKGAAPTEIESSVTKKVEDAVGGISNIDKLYSETTEGVSTVIIEFKLGTDLVQALQDVRDSVNRIRNELPETIDEPIIKKADPSASPIQIYSISSISKTPLELTELVENRISPIISKAEGVADVQVRGGYEREIQVYLSPDRLKAHNITAVDVSNQLRQNNVNLPSGKASMGQNDSLVRTLGSASDIEKLQSTMIRLNDGSVVPLTSLGRVVDSYEERYISSSLNGKSSINFYITRESGSSIVSTDKAIKEKLKEVNEILPKDVELSLIHSLADYIEESNTASHEAVIHGAFLAVAVILYFLRDRRATFISGIAIPLSLAGTYIGMYIFDLSFNFMTLLAIALVVGILVDDAIVDLENIVRHVREGKHPFKAAIEATDEIGLAVIACTFTIVAVFFPMIFMEGIVGQFFKSFGLVVSISVLLSLVIARTITPVLASILLKPFNREEAERKNALYKQKMGFIEKYNSDVFMEKTQKIYVKALTWALNNRWKTIFCSIGLFIAGIALVASPYLAKSFMTEADRSMVSISVKLPEGSSLMQTQKVVDQIYKAVKDRKEVKDVYTDAGNGVGATNTGLVGVLLVDKNERNISDLEFKKQIRPLLKQIPGVKTSLASVDLVSGETAPAIQLVLSGEDYKQVSDYSEKLVQEMSKIPGLTDVNSQAATVKPEWDVSIDSGRLSDLGVSTLDIARTLNIATQGEESSKFIEGGEEHDIRVQLERNIRNDVEEIYNLEVPSRQGFNVPVKSVAALEAKSGPAKITRKDQKRYVLVEADLDGIALSDGLGAINKLDTFKNPPEGIKVDFEGDVELQKDAFGSLTSALFIGIVFIYVILAMLFESFIHPLTIMVSLPLSVAGAFFSLFLTAKELNLMSFIGFIVLMGIVTKNSILLLEYTITEKAKGISTKQALIEAGKVRIRPILMTSIATIAGLLPIALGISAGSEVRSPMGVAVIGGIVTSTVLTLVVIPVVYSLFDDLEALLRRKFFEKDVLAGEIESREEIELVH